jgi:hypothetical protein
MSIPTLEGEGSQIVRFDPGSERSVGGREVVAGDREMASVPKAAAGYYRTTIGTMKKALSLADGSINA